MNNEPYSNREINMKFEQLKLMMETKHEENKETLQEILAQTKTTNGRVSILERWQSYVLGFCAAVAILLLPVLMKLF